MIHPKKVTMRCGGKKCCPELTVDEDWIVITDDFGGKIRIPSAHREQFQAAVTDLLSDAPG